MNDATAYAALDDRVLVVRGRGDDPTSDGADPSATDDWTADEPLVGHDCQCVAASPDESDRAFVGTVESGIHRSADGGDAWERVAPDIDDRVTALAVSPHDPDTIWAGTEPSAVYRSTDGGDSWEALPPLSDLPSESGWSSPPRTANWVYISTHATTI